jgi:hypothetical protein
MLEKIAIALSLIFLEARRAGLDARDAQGRRLIVRLKHVVRIPPKSRHPSVRQRRQVHANSAEKLLAPIFAERIFTRVPINKESQPNPRLLEHSWGLNWSFSKVLSGLSTFSTEFAHYGYRQHTCR